MLKLEGLTDEQARRVGVPSGTSLLGLVQHLAAVEVGWFQLKFAASDAPEPSESPDNLRPVADHVTAYRTAISRSNEVVAASSSLSERCEDPQFANLSLRWVLIHMIEETARHAGHADIIREHLDGTTGR